MYKTEKINELTMKITDRYGEVIYLLLGTEHALLIDSGMEKSNLLDVVSSITSLPVILALTHGHIDHIGRSGDFDQVYMELADITTYLSHMQINVGHFNSNGLNFKDIKQIKSMPAFFDLGDRQIEVIPLPGHTPGSVIFVDKLQKMVFTGDAIGSGCGCWMQLDESLSILEYQQYLHTVIEKLTVLGVDDNWQFFGGHDHQEYESQVSEFNRLDFQLLKDMEQLCIRLLHHEIVFHDTKALKMTNQPYYVSYGKAEMIITKEKTESC
ncbi:MBL fold metallo-hydrolase [[Clostridium] spiroforme]|nr:MBL fold metallo-hydrolase [Thomasclavelia spiroformis]MBM6879862.1 MBL fold metallo-hydrolase [Thomasclavelia spiroformis]